MSWETFLQKIKFFDGSQSVDPNKINNLLVQNEKDQIISSLYSLYHESGIAAGILESVTQYEDLVISGTSYVELAFARTPPRWTQRYVAFNLDAISDFKYFNDKGVLVNEDYRISIIHEILHLYFPLGNDSSPNMGVNNPDYDFKGDIIPTQNLIASQLGLVNNRQASYLATVKPDILGEFIQGYSYSHDENVDIVLIDKRNPDFNSPGWENFNFDTSQREDGSRDLVFGRSGADVIKTGAGNDFIYGGTGNDVITPGPGVDFVDGGENFDVVTLDLPVSAGEETSGAMLSAKVVRGAGNNKSYASLEYGLDQLNSVKLIDVEYLKLTSKSDTIILGDIGPYVPRGQEPGSRSPLAKLKIDFQETSIPKFDDDKIVISGSTSYSASRTFANGTTQTTDKVGLRIDLSNKNNQTVQYLIDWGGGDKVRSAVLATFANANSVIGYDGNDEVEPLGARSGGGNSNVVLEGAGGDDELIGFVFERPVAVELHFLKGMSGRTGLGFILFGRVAVDCHGGSPFKAALLAAFVATPGGGGNGAAPCRCARPERQRRMAEPRLFASRCKGAGRARPGGK